MADTIKYKTKNHEIINKFVTVEFSKDKYFWPREMKIAKNLLEKYGYEFLLWLKPPHNYKVGSLSFFISKNGQEYLIEQKFQFLKQNINVGQKESIIETEIESKKIGEDIIIVKQPKTLKEYLNYGKK